MHLQWPVCWLMIFCFMPVAEAQDQDVGLHEIQDAIGKRHMVMNDGLGDLYVEFYPDIGKAFHELASLRPELRNRVTRLDIQDISSDEVDWDLLTELPNIRFIWLGDFDEEVVQKWNPRLGRNLRKLANLKYLLCVDIELDDRAIRDLGECVSLNWLDLGSPDLAGVDLAPLGNLGKLSQLHLNESNIEDGQLLFLGGLSELVWLDLSGNELTDAAIGTLAPFSEKSLEALFLGDTKLTPEGVEQLRKLLPDCAISAGTRRQQPCNLRGVEQE